VLKEYIASGVSKEDFVARMQRALQPAQPAAAPPQPGSIPAPTPAAAPPQPAPSPVGESTSSTSSGRATPLSSNETQIQSVLAERAARLAVEKKKQEEEARKRRLEKGKAKADDTPTPESQRKHADQYRKKQQQARDERERILRAIEDDKAARRAKKAEMEAVRRAAAAAEETEPKPESDVPFAPASPLFPTSGRISEYCALQVRLFNGSTIRSRFSSHDTLKDVRQWIDDTPSDSPKAAYTFKILLTPLPSKTIDVTEESKQVHELGLTPSATLILLPAPKTAARAFATAPGEGNIITRVIASILAFISGLIALIFSFFSTLFSTAGPPGGPTQESTTAGGSQARASGRDSSRIADPRRNWSERGNDQQFYNGNSVCRRNILTVHKLLTEL